MKSDWYCTLQTVSICQWFEKASIITIKVNIQQEVCCGVEMHKLTKCKWAIDVWLKLTCVATFIQSSSYDTINKH